MENRYSGKNVLTLGLGKSGLSAVKLLARLGASVSASDIKTRKELERQAAELPPGVRLIAGDSGNPDMAGFDLAVISPGVRLSSPCASAAENAGVEIISEVELAWTMLESPVIAITGSNGKSTTTALVGRILESAGMSVYVGGNIGAPLCDAVGERYDWVVAEISSFQLETIKTFRPRIAMILNITPDHLDRHGDMETYAALKTRIYENQGAGDALVLNADAPGVAENTADKSSGAFYFSKNPISGPGVFAQDGRVMARLDGEPTELFKVDELLIKGPHNLENAMAASLAGLLAGAAPDAVKTAVTGFAGLPHRMELVGEVNAVSYYNDSKATNVDSAVRSLSAFSKNVALIAGGSSKGADYKLLASAVRQRAIGVVLIGQSAPDIEKELGDYQPRAMAKDMEEAVRIAARWCEPGDSVLLAPACASFGMFRNFEERGAAFRSAVEKSAEACGQCL